MVKVSDSNIFTPFKKAYDFGDRCDIQDIGADEKNENVCASDGDDESSEEEHAHTNQSEQENQMSHLSHLSQPEEFARVLEQSDGKLYKSQAEELGYDPDNLSELAAESSQVEEGFGTPDDSNSVQTCWTLPSEAVVEVVDE